MADLMTGSFEYSKLQSQYKDFVVPAIKFEVGGSDLMKKNVHLSEVEAVLMLNGASSVTVRFVDCYDPKNGSFDSNLKSAAVLGKTVELSLGYGSSFQKVFKGYLSNVRMNASIDEGMWIEFVALDARRLMMTDNFHVKEYKIKNYSDAVSEILKRYSKLGTAQVDATSENFEDGLIWQNGSDYDFITRELIDSGKAEREFFIAVDKIYFRKPRSVTAPALTLKPGLGLRSFQSDAGYIDENISVIGFDPLTGKAVSGKAPAKAAGSTTSAVGTQGERFMSDPSLKNASQAAAHAKAVAARRVAKTQRATIGCVGIPELIPGRFIKIDRLDSLANKKYYITQVTHRCNREGFLTSIETEGWE